MRDIGLFRHVVLLTDDRPNKTNDPNRFRFHQPKHHPHGSTDRPVHTHTHTISCGLAGCVCSKELCPLAAAACDAAHRSPAGLAAAASRPPACLALARALRPSTAARQQPRRARTHHPAPSGGMRLLAADPCPRPRGRLIDPMLSHRTSPGLDRSIDPESVAGGRVLVDGTIDRGGMEWIELAMMMIERCWRARLTKRPLPARGSGNEMAPQSTHPSTPSTPPPGSTARCFKAWEKGRPPPSHPTPATASPSAAARVASVGALCY